MPNVDQIAEVQLAYTIAALSQIEKNLKHENACRGMSSDEKIDFIMKSLREMSTGFDLHSALLRCPCAHDFDSRDELFGSELHTSNDDVSVLLNRLKAYIEGLDELFTWNGQDGYWVEFCDRTQAYHVATYDGESKRMIVFDLRTMN